MIFLQGIIKFLISLFYDFTKLLDAYSIVVADVSSNTFYLCNSGINFLPAEVMKGDKTTGWLVSDCSKINKVWLWIWQNINNLVFKKFNTTLVDTTKHASKMRIACLKFYNQPIPAKINNRRNTVLEHKKEYFSSK